MTPFNALLFIALLAPQAPSQGSVAPAPAARPAPCTAPVFREFDFWVGQWDVLDPNGKFVGTSRVERVGDCFLQETWVTASGGYTGRSLNSVGFDRKWHQTWTDTSGLRLELTGGLLDAKMVMEGQKPSPDPSRPPVRTRITWSSEVGGVVRQFVEASLDGGNTWAPSFDGRYHPAPSGPASIDGFFGRIAGGWIGSGSVMGRDSHVEFRVERGVGSTVRLHWRNVMQGVRRDVFEGSAVYERKAEGEYVATWWDSQGAKHPIVATVGTDGSTLTALWGEAGKTLYSLSGGELEVVDSVKRPDGAWAEFGRTKLKKQ